MVIWIKFYKDPYLLWILVEWKKNEGDPYKMLNVKFVQSGSIFAVTINSINKILVQKFTLEDTPFQILVFTWNFHNFFWDEPIYHRQLIWSVWKLIAYSLVDAWTGGGRLPNEPTGLCSPKIQDSVNKAMKKKQEYGYDMNLVIQRKKMFRNPSIYEKLIQFCEIDETGTNLPKDLYDGHLFGKESYYDELAKGRKIWKENLSCL